MCGIVGVAGYVDYNLEKTFKLMLELDVIRGRHSTGIFSVAADGTVLSAKEAWLPQDLLESRAAKSIFAQTNIRLLVGHNRHATVGAVNKAGAHPFEFDSVIGVHNGTTPKHHFKNGHSYTVDSEALYDHVDNEGVEDMWKHMAGAASLVMYHKHTEQLQLLRNKERPMCVAVVKGGSTILFASEAWMIEVAAAKNGIAIGEVVNTTVNDLVTFKPLERGTVKFKTEKLTGYVAPKSNVTNLYGKTKHVLNRVAKSLQDVHVGDILEFKFDRIEQMGNTTIGRILTTNTPVAIEGKVYLGMATDMQMADFFSDDSEWKGNVSSVAVGGAYKGFTVSLSSVEEVTPFEDRGGLLPDEDEAIVFEGNHKTYTKEDFVNERGISNCCSWCGSPGDFDTLDFKGAGYTQGRQDIVCDDCLNDNRDTIETYCEIQEVYDCQLTV